MNGLASAVCIWLALSLPSASASHFQESADKTIPGEGMYPRSSRGVGPSQDRSAEGRIQVGRQDTKNQIFVTQWRSYDAALFPRSRSGPTSARSVCNSM